MIHSGFMSFGTNKSDKLQNICKKYLTALWVDLFYAQKCRKYVKKQGESNDHILLCAKLPFLERQGHPGF
jgi:hypothetical protein